MTNENETVCTESISEEDRKKLENARRLSGMSIKEADLPCLHLLVGTEVSELDGYCML